MLTGTRQRRAASLAHKHGIHPLGSLHDYASHSALCRAWGCFPIAEEAARAYDIGYILFRGTHGKINTTLDQYIDCATGCFHASVDIPSTVEVAVQRYLKKAPAAIKDKMLQRIVTYFTEGACPFT